MARFSRLPLLFFALPFLAACPPETPVGTFAGLDRDYLLTTSTPEYGNLSTIRLRYEDDWVPRTCEGVTYVSEQDNVIFEWRCNVGGQLAFFTGGLSDEDGDGTYTGTIIGNPTTPGGTLTPLPVAGDFTMTPCARNGGNGPCSE